MGEMEEGTLPDSQSSSFSNITWVGIIIGMGGLLFLVGMLFGRTSSKQEEMEALHADGILVNDERQDDIESPQ